MEVENVKIELLKSHPQNPRVGDVEAIAESIKANGWWGTVVAQKTTNHVLAGNHRILAAKSLDIKEVPVYWVDVDDDQALKILLADNRTNDLATYDEQILADLLQEITFNTDEGLTGTGYEVGDLDDLLRDLTIIDKPEKELIEPPEDPTTKPGDLWILGNHRLLCGDSTNPQHVERLMDGKKADMVFTDPPYNIGYQDMGAKFEKIANDKMSESEFLQFLKNTIQPLEIMYVCCSWQFAHLFKQAMTELGVAPKSMIIWDKVNPAQNLDLYYKQHEIIFYFGPFGGQSTVRGDVWQLKRQRNTLHPTMKPVELIEMALEDQPKSKIVLDSFGGSGSTLIACERKHRHARLMELDPAYCDVIVKRWEDFTGKTAQTSGNCPESTVKTDSTTPHPNQSTQ